MRRARTVLAAAAGILLSACRSAPELQPVDYVDIERFMGDWYVIANIPTFLEEGAHNAIESYRLDEDGTIATTFTFHDGDFNGPLKEYNPRGFVVDGTGNAVWGMQFVWPVKADYRIIYLAADYSVTIIGHNPRNYVWLMARTPEIDEAAFEEAKAFIESVGYDVSQLQRVPQQW
jgi:apolipoprotein D and lipocalin family protein